MFSHSIYNSDWVHTQLVFLYFDHSVSNSSPLLRKDSTTSDCFRLPATRGTSVGPSHQCSPTDRGGHRTSGSWLVSESAGGLLPLYSDQLGGTLRYIKFKMRRSYFGHGESYMSQLAENSGGDWLYNSFGLSLQVVWLVEGEHDALRLWQSKKIVAVGISGNCSEKTERFREVMSLKGKRVILAFDLDGAGEEYCQQFENLKLANEVFLARGNGKYHDEWLMDPDSVSLARVG